MQWPALFRFREFAPIEKVYYDIESSTIKGLRFPAVYGPAEDYILPHEKLVQERYEFMYERMDKNSKLIAIAFVNSAYYMSMYTDHVEGCDLEGGDVVSVIGYYDYLSLVTKPMICVGFERTFCPAIGPLITPGRIFYDKQIDKIYYKGYWVSFKEGTPVEFKSKALYKEMIQQKNVNGVVYIGNDRHIYLR